ncbi:TPA: hypothetical protein ACJTPC_000255 [Providencia alcalifaciens]
MNSVGKFTPHTGILDGGIVPSNNGDKSTYYIQKVRKFITSDKDGIQEYTNVRGLDVVGKTEYTNIRLKRQDGTYLSLETVPKQDANASGAGFANLIHRDANNTNIAVIAIPNKNGMLMQHGDYGFGGIGSQAGLNDSDIIGIFKDGVSQIWRTNSANSKVYQYGCNFIFKSADTFSNISVEYQTAKVVITSGVTTDTGTFKTNSLYGTANTTKDANGNLKAASPVIKVFSDHIELNDESEGIELEKLGTGRYKLKGTLGMNSDASWGGYNGGLVAPLGINGLELLWVDYKVLPDGDIIIETNYRKHSDLPPPVLLKRLITYPEFMDENGDELESYAPVDIPNGHWIDVRVNMPSDSIYNQKLAEAERLAKIEAERVAKEDAEKAAREEAERLEEESKQEQASKLEE